MMSDNSSENSVLRSDGSTDIHAKYTRLAAEYSKVRAQNVVLKKAVVDEQSKNQEISERMREKDQIIRKSNQEMESLNFRNLQLARRVTVLQEEIDLVDMKGVKKKTKSIDVPNGTTADTILNEELKKIIVENAKLLAEINDKEEANMKIIQSQKEEIKTLNYELEQCKHKLKQTVKDSQLALEQLKKEQSEFKREYLNKLNKLKETEVELSATKNAHKSYVSDVGPKLDSATRLISKYIPFTGEEDPLLNRLNVKYTPGISDETSYSELLKENFSSFLAVFYSIMHNITTDLEHLGIEELRIYIKTLLKEDDGILLNEKLNSCYVLLKNIGLESSHEESMEYFIHHFIYTFLDLSACIYASYMSNSSNLKNINGSDCTNDKSVKSCLQNFQKKKEELIQHLIMSSDFKYDVIEEEFSSFNFITNKLITAIEHIEYRRIQSSSQRSLNPYGFKTRAASYLRSLKMEKTESIPYEEALQNKKKLQEYIMLNNVLQDELYKLSEAVSSLEKEKSNLEDEVKLYQLRLQNEIQEDGEINSGDLEETSNIIGKVIKPKISASCVARENDIKQYYSERINELMMLKQDAVGMTKTFILECKVLQRRLENSLVERQLMENRYLQCHKTQLNLQEELTTVSQNYELQLSMMSEHLANVNDKIASQSEEIDNLNFQLKNKGHRKTKK